MAHKTFSNNQRSKEEIMVKIRLKRIGAHKKPFYRVVVADSRTPRDGSVARDNGGFPWKPPFLVCLACEERKRT